MWVKGRHQWIKKNDNDGCKSDGNDGNLNDIHGYNGDGDDDEEYIVLKLDYFQPCTGQHAFHPLLLTQSILFNNRDVDDVDDFSHLLF